MKPIFSRRCGLVLPENLITIIITMRCYTELSYISMCVCVLELCAVFTFCVFPFHTVKKTQHSQQCSQMQCISPLWPHLFCLLSTPEEGHTSKWHSEIKFCLHLIADLHLPSVSPLRPVPAQEFRPVTQAERRVAFPCFFFFFFFFTFLSLFFFLIHLCF